MSEPSLEQVKRLAEQLSPEERIQLWKHLADLPDSDIHKTDLDPQTVTPDGEEIEGAGDKAVVLSTDTSAALFLKRRIMLQVRFYPDNFRQSRMEVRSWKDTPPTEKVKGEIREILRLHGEKEPTEEEIIEAAKQPTLRLFEVETERFAHEFSKRLPSFTWLLFEAGMKIVDLGFHNDFARRSGQRTKTLDEMVKILEPYWKHIKEHLNLAPGGRRNVKHEWTIRDYACLTVHYEKLKPIWREAKSIAKSAQNSKERTRQQRWKEEVAAIYQEQDLPTDLIELLSLPQATAPADLALTHASRLCIPDTPYSLKVLKEKLKYYKSGARISFDNSENEGSSSEGV